MAVTEAEIKRARASIETLGLLYRYGLRQGEFIRDLFPADGRVPEFRLSKENDNLFYYDIYANQDRGARKATIVDGQVRVFDGTAFINKQTPITADELKARITQYATGKGFEDITVMSASAFNSKFIQPFQTLKAIVASGAGPDQTRFVAMIDRMASMKPPFTDEQAAEVGRIANLAATSLRSISGLPKDKVDAAIASLERLGKLAYLDPETYISNKIPLPALETANAQTLSTADRTNYDAQLSLFKGLPSGLFMDMNAAIRGQTTPVKTNAAMPELTKALSGPSIMGQAKGSLQDFISGLYKPDSVTAMALNDAKVMGEAGGNIVRPVHELTQSINETLKRAGYTPAEILALPANKVSAIMTKIYNSPPTTVLQPQDILNLAKDVELPPPAKPITKAEAGERSGTRLAAAHVEEHGGAQLTGHKRPEVDAVRSTQT